MLFSSLGFLYYFLPLVVIVYFLTPDRYKNLLLLTASLIFYGWGEPRLVLLMVFSILVHYLLALAMEKNRRKSKTYLALSLVFQLGLLGYFKYSNFFIDNINQLLKTSLPLLNLALPLGISFYSFQIIGYSIDVYRKDTKAQRSFIKLASYIALFPQLIAGPIIRYRDIEKSLDNRSHSLDKFWQGFSRFILGLSKKVLLANNLGILVASYKGLVDPDQLFTWLYALAFCLQIYFDFSGYSDMALGLARIFGFDFPENFNYPYMAMSLRDFWSRWHISLGTWFRDYVYIPLGGNRVPKKRWVFNFFIVWLLTGFWHGAAWNFIFWGLYFGILLISERLYTERLLEKLPNLLRRVYALTFILFGFIIFDADSMAQAFSRISLLFSADAFATIESLYLLRSNVFLILLGFLASTDLAKKLWMRLSLKKTLKDLLEAAFILILVILVTAYLVDSAYNPFLYFRF